MLEADPWQVGKSEWRRRKFHGRSGGKICMAFGRKQKPGGMDDEDQLKENREAKRVKGEARMEIRE
jgi:hypothetical protein